MILGYEPAGHQASPKRVSIEAPGCHSLSSAYKDELIAAMHELKPRRGARLVLFGCDVAGLPDAERKRLMARVGFVPANGGLMSNLNAWENIALPLAYHAPGKLARAFGEVQALLGELGGVNEEILGKLPEDMSLYERRLAAFMRAVLESPDLLVAENLFAGLGPTKRRRAARFAEVYHARCPRGTFVQFDG